VSRQFLNFTLDLDDCEPGYLWFRIRQVMESMSVDRVFYRRSSSGDGFHVKVFLSEPVELEEHFMARFWLGDDPHRLFYDFSREVSGVRISQVMFDQKGGRVAEEWTELT